MVEPTEAGSLIPLSDTNHTSLGKSGAAVRAASIASDVFPAPPGPVSVTSGALSTARSSRPRSASRATKELSRAGRFVGDWCKGTGPCSVGS